MELKEAINCLENMISDYVISAYCEKCSNTDNCTEECYFTLAIDTVLAELDKQNETIGNYKNTIEVIEDLGRKKISEIVEKAESRVKTNGDKIRQMNNEELAKLMSHECMCCMQGEYCETSCKEGIKAFLDEEAE